jgi:hypothetical protein
MNLIKNDELINIFQLLNKSKLNYILMRNINDEIPSKLKTGKDIDILISKKNYGKFINFFKDNQYKKISHPHKYDTFLYGVDKFEFKYNANNKIIFDLNFQIAVRSLDAGQWIPLDQVIQKSAWKNKRFEQKNEDFGYWTLSHEDEMVCLIARSILDKEEFKDGYINRINELYDLIDKENIMKKLNLIFFKFTPDLIGYIENKQYSKIIQNYIQFKEY